MATSAEAICNEALQELGEQPITSLSDTTKRAEACNLIYASERDRLLKSHPWKFALRRVKTSLNENTRFTLLQEDGGWTASSLGTNEYYLPPSNTKSFKTKPDNMFENDSSMTEGTIGSLTAGQWGWGDNDSLGIKTIYVRLTDNTDPDTKYASDNDYLEATYDTPAFTWDFGFPQPAWSLQIWEMKDITLTQIAPAWDTEQSIILTNTSEINMRFTVQITDTTVFDEFFEKTLVFALAVKLAIALPDKRSYKSDMIAQFDAALSEAGSKNSIEGNIRVERNMQSERALTPWQSTGRQGALGTRIDRFGIIE
jgi:hypothetical protein